MLAGSFNERRKRRSTQRKGPNKVCVEADGYHDPFVAAKRQARRPVCDSPLRASDAGADNGTTPMVAECTLHCAGVLVGAGGHVGG